MRSVKLIVYTRKKNSWKLRKKVENIEKSEQNK